ncbi:hypothetical protein [Streptomyces sp. Ag109_G2-15]|uniref:hypothetical protein n=1 Tax=Streptomyces sp. Ag109_G2-15 TaxID=1938850 RepID=UPI0015CF132E|nr:hypothetical protein [Streptomyces sp. Ag109_G2-15]
MLDHNSSSMITAASGMRPYPLALASQTYPGQQYQARRQAIEQKSGPGYRL